MAIRAWTLPLVVGALDLGSGEHFGESVWSVPVEAGVVPGPPPLVVGRRADR